MTGIISLIGDVHGQAPKMCMHHSEAFGFVEDTTHPKIEAGRVEGDIMEVAALSTLTAAFSRPTEILVCADEKYVHGIQITIQP